MYGHKKINISIKLTATKRNTTQLKTLNENKNNYPSPPSKRVMKENHPSEYFTKIKKVMSVFSVATFQTSTD